jgi:hypothetical protein
MCIVPGSTPVLSFGPLSTATVATLGLNPSRDEFLDLDGSELQGNNRRLATLTSLSTTDLSLVHTNTLLQIVNDYETYFGRKPYHHWFDQLDYILAACGASYYNGSACHLDLIQWATDPKWSRLNRSVRSTLLEADAPFLAKQLSNSQVRVLLINGKAVFKQFQSRFGTLNEEPPIVLNSGEKSDLWSGTVLGTVRVIAWSRNLQSSFGVTSEFRAALRDRVAVLAKKLLSESKIAERTTERPAAK